MKSNYQFDKTVQINSSLKQQCNVLYQECCTADKLKHPCCFEDEFDRFTDFPRLYSVSSEKKLLGFLSVYIIDSNHVEFCIFVHPDYRSQQLGKRLLKYFFTDYDKADIDVCIHPENKSDIVFLNDNNFHLSSTELLMELSFNSARSKNSLPQKNFTSNTFKYIIDNECVGSCNVSCLSDIQVCISHVIIFNPYKNRGLGYEFMKKVCHEISKDFKKVLLHVSQENIPAYKLYKKLKFKEIESTLIYTYGKKNDYNL